MNIAFANELSLICDRLDVDVSELIALANLHPRVNILQPGPGVGGHCIAVDPWFIVASAPQEAQIIRTARQVNDGKPEWVLRKIMAAVAAHEGPSPMTVACYGIAFKPNIDDLRESPSLHIVKELLDRHNGPILIVEPNIKTLPESLSSADLVTLDKAREGADLHVVLVAHDPFKTWDFAPHTLYFTSL
ncbi:UDP binding domain-containing protein [Roseobacter litoralis]|uniref:UDP binding domain-containing protein n=1 Tax=Roseobacter litoralis TaxID=42443 RepID=UPI0031E9EA60